MVGHGVVYVQTDRVGSDVARRRTRRRTVGPLTSSQTCKSASVGSLCAHFSEVASTIASPSSRSPPSSRARPGMQETNPERGASSASTGQASQIDENAKRMVAQGRDIFRDDTLGSEDYFGAA